MVYFPRETISFSHSTVLSSAGFSSLFCHFYTSFCFPVAASLSTVFMCLCVSTDWESALLEKTDKVPLVKQNGFSALECLILYFLVGGSFFLSFSVSFAPDVGLEGHAALWLDFGEDALNLVNIVIG